MSENTGADPGRRVCASVVIGTGQRNTVTMGGGAPVVVQAMTDTETTAVAATVAQVLALSDAGAELVRLAIKDRPAAEAVPRIRDALLERGCQVPLVGDFHYNGHKLLEQVPECARVLDKYRINPGNVGLGRRRDLHFAAFIELACRHDKPVRIGVNGGSLDQVLLEQLMQDNARLPNPASAAEVWCRAAVDSALTSAAEAEALGLPHDRIVISCKMSAVPDVIRVYRQLAIRCDYPLHVGLTEAGMGLQGVVASSAALAVLIQEGIGDTIRISLTPRPGAPRTDEVAVACQLLQALGLRTLQPRIVSCPGCGRTDGRLFREMAAQVEHHVAQRLAQWRASCPGVAGLQVAVMGCVVNGPGESRQADIGISLPGVGEHPAAPVFIEGRHVTTLHGQNLVDDFLALLDDYVLRRFGGLQPAGEGQGSFKGPANATHSAPAPAVSP